ncbi:hydrolase, alpha/beta superfamily [Mariniradius saccharolyticus AK6]|uniref:Hydrolase, alpha/beta superfamily n=1 Tax=Mariniradius saccharolyticus AK6 TaxID=1239962 RepID=M7Y4R0_9BACT|nr:alpha/beta fold hydrolase [Mariniradius saccharolyticus]EMS32241.1 hydrolase, alpha/beta superfamily [Mariniradius saccharolyticus AK6]
MSTRFLETSFGHLAYKRHGKGSEVFVLFHGFGQSMKVYDPYLPLRKENESYLVFDIFYHGQSSWKTADKKLTKEIWREIWVQLMAEEKFDAFHLIGYSMGGKFCLVTYELFPERVKSLLLMAPDGIKTGFWYNMATFPGYMNRLFKRVVFHPDRFFRVMDFLHSLGLLQSSLIKFVKSQMQTRTMRAQIYFTWSVFKPLQPDIGKIIVYIRERGTPAMLVTGKYDKMITSKNLQRFNSKIPHLQQVELECGHNDLIEKTAKFLIKNPVKIGGEG